MKLDTAFSFTLVYILLINSSEFPSVAADVGSVISESLFEQLLKHRNDAICEGKVYVCWLLIFYVFEKIATITMI